MLVLSRKENEEIWIDNGRIKLYVTHIGRLAVKIGIEAPPAVIIKRKEIISFRIQNKNKRHI